MRDLSEYSGEEIEKQTLENTLVISQDINLLKNIFLTMHTVTAWTENSGTNGPSTTTLALCQCDFRNSQCQWKNNNNLGILSLPWYIPQVEYKQRD